MGLKAGNRLGYTETHKPVYETPPTRPRFSVTITGRTGCGKSARPGPWGCRRESAGTTRQYPAVNTHEFKAFMNKLPDILPIHEPL